MQTNMLGRRFLTDEDKAEDGHGCYFGGGNWYFQPM